MTGFIDAAKADILAKAEASAELTEAGPVQPAPPDNIVSFPRSES